LCVFRHIIAESSSHLGGCLRKSLLHTLRDGLKTLKVQRVVIFVHLFLTTFMTTLFFSSMIGQKQ